MPAAAASRPQTNAELAQRLLALAQQLQAKGENPYKVRAYRRGAETVAGLSQSVDREVRTGSDLTRHPGIGKGIASALKELVEQGSLGQLEILLTETPPEVAALSEYPDLDPKRVLRAYKKLGINTVAALKEKLESGEVEKTLGARMAAHFREAFQDVAEILLYDADPLVRALQRFLEKQSGVTRVEPAGDWRRRVETVKDLSFVMAAQDFPAVVEAMREYGGGTPLESATAARATFALAQGISLHLHLASLESWGAAAILATGSEAHVEKLREHAGTTALWAKAKGGVADEKVAYRALRLAWVPPELREGRNEVELASEDRLPTLVTVEDLRGELHAHTTASDGEHSIQEMAEACRARGYAYLGITDHSQSLKIARGVSEADLRKQIANIDRLNARGLGIRILKSTEADILADGSLDYPDELLAELDYTVCSIHSRFRLGKQEQTDRILRAMENPHFTILGHATGRLLLKRMGYEIDFDRVLEQAKACGVFLEINSSPDRLDLSADMARQAKAAGVRIAVNTDAHHTRELEFVRYGIDVARRAGLEAADVVTTWPWPKLVKAFSRSTAASSR